MKKVFLVVLLLALMCGCDKTKPEYLVSAMGFDSDGGGYSVCFESIVINTENNEQKLLLLKGKGETIKTAVDEIYRQCTQPVLLSHCGVIAVGEGINKNRFKEICEFCYDKEQITLSAFFVKTKNAENLLSFKPISSTCAGYDIMGLIKQNKGYKNRFFEIINSNFKAELPLISLTDGGIIFE
jgi:hypothetical protein